jgi:hypothetical protein
MAKADFDFYSGMVIGSAARPVGTREGNEIVIRFLISFFPKRDLSYGNSP